MQDDSVTGEQAPVDESSDAVGEVNLEYAQQAANDGIVTEEPRDRIIYMVLAGFLAVLAMGGAMFFIILPGVFET